MEGYLYLKKLMDVPHAINVAGYSKVVREIAKRNTKNSNLKEPTAESIDKLYEIVANLIIQGQSSELKPVTENLKRCVYLLAEEAIYFHLNSFNHDSLEKQKRNGFESCLKQMETVFRNKNRDYGNSFRFWGVTGVVVRIGDKVFRIRQLSNKRYKQKISDERIPDTALDLANYVIMLLMLLNEKRGIKLGR